MALSYFSDFGYVYPPQTQTEIATEFFDKFAVSDSFVNPLYEFEDEPLFYSSDSYTNLLPYFSSSPSDNAISLSPDIFPLQELEDSYHHYYPKRHKSCADNFQLSSSSFNPSYFNGHVSNFDQVLFPEFLQEIPVPVVLPKFAIPEPAASTFNEGRTTNYNENSHVMKKPSVSTQSIAARERRRKITDKTQELGKLIPGGNKMNTAEMLQSAFKYVNFLQAQVRVLENMESIEEIRNEDLHKHDDEELQILLTSPRIQEKLYSQEKCLVPREFLETKVNDQEIQSTPSIIDEIYQLLLGTN